MTNFQQQLLGAVGAIATGATVKRGLNAVAPIKTKYQSGLEQANAKLDKQDSALIRGGNKHGLEPNNVLPGQTMADAFYLSQQDGEADAGAYIDMMNTARPTDQLNNKTNASAEKAQKAYQRATVEMARFVDPQFKLSKDDMTALRMARKLRQKGGNK